MSSEIAFSKVFDYYKARLDGLSVEKCLNDSVLNTQQTEADIQVLYAMSHLCAKLEERVQVLEAVLKTGDSSNDNDNNNPRFQT